LSEVVGAASVCEDSWLVAQEGNRPAHESTVGMVDDDVYLQAVARAAESAGAVALDDQTIVDGVRVSVPEVGQVLAGKYRVERFLGVGGMGVVVAARHLQLDAPVAMKFMTEQTAADGHLVARFLREARATARLRGEHVVRVSDIGELDSGAPYMVMEFLQGQDLAALLTSLGTPPIASAVDYAIQACEGLAEAHGAGIVHRDVKPANLFLTRRPNGTACIKVVDFGISKAVAMADPSNALHATNTGAVFGSPMYMAPEQMRAAHDVDARADVWSLGATLYELLTGVVPFAAESLVDLAYRIANEQPAPVRVRRPEVPYELEQVVLRCLEKDRNHRFAGVRHLASALEPFRGPRALEAHRDDEDETHFIDGDRLLRAAEYELAGAPLRPSIDTTSLTEIEAPPSAPPPRPSAAESLRESVVSWGQSLRPVRPRSRALVLWAGLGAAVVVATALGGSALLGGHDAPAAPAIPTERVAARPSAPPAPSVVLAPVESAVPAEAVAVPEPTTEVKTVSVTDLPMAAPVAAPFMAAAPSTAPFIAAAPSTAPLVAAAPAGMTAPGAPAAAGEAPRLAPATVERLGIPKAIAAFASASPAARPPPSCSPPYFYDELGLKVFKPECVN
jgi:serine/threonine protein kinase